MMLSTNLALRPFRNERLPWIMAAALMAGALVVSFVHGRFVSRLLLGDEAKTVRAVREDEARIGELEQAIAKEPPLKIEAAELARLRAYKELVDRRVFPWRALLAELEGTLSNDVRLSRISPVAARGIRGMMIDLAGVARSKEVAFSLAETLDASPVFENASLKSLSDEEEGTEFLMEVVFDPEGRPAPRMVSAGLPATTPVAPLPPMPRRPR